MLDDQVHPAMFGRVRRLLSLDPAAELDPQTE